MPRFTSPMDDLSVAAPCPADWDRMVGDERVRFCQQCERNVYNLSSMTRREAENLVAGAEGRLCVRFYRRHDGTVLTANCPVGLRALKRRASRVAGACVSAVLGFFAGLGLSPGPPGRWIPIVGAGAVPPPSHGPEPAGGAPHATPPVGQYITGDLMPPKDVGQVLMGRISLEAEPRAGKRRRK